jgi:predicted component of type VI protein secretion system
MSSSYLSVQKNRYRITLEIESLEDFNPHQIDWKKLFKLEPNEKVKSYVEDLNVRW